YALTSRTRWYYGLELAEAGRYLYVAAALTLPGLALAAQGIARRWPRAAPALVVVLVIGIPANLGELEGERQTAEFAARERQTILGIAHHDGIDEAPGWVEPSPASHRIEGVVMTVDWLLRA